MKKYDLVVIGSGPAGEKAAAKAAYFKYKVAIIEKSKKVGGAGINTGTMPSKTLKETALFYSGRSEKGLYGVERVLEDAPSIEQFMHRQNLVNKTTEKEVFDNISNHKIDLYHGLASFDSQNEVRIKGIKEEVIWADNIIIATGSYPYHPPNIPFDGTRIHDSDSILKMPRFPKSLCIIGAGVIGCEYATIFGSMNIDVFLVNDKKRILTFLDHEISIDLVRQMKELSINVLFETKFKKITVPKNDAEPIDLELESGEVLHIDMILYAAGRVGSIQGLNLEKIGVKLGERQVIAVNERFQTSIPNIYAVGDVIGFPALASTSMDQGRVAVSHIFNTKDLDALPKIFPYGIYTIPEVSMVGLTEEQAKEAKIDYQTGTARYKNSHRGIIKGTRNGFLKIIFRKEDLVIIGVHIIGEFATELIHFGLTLIENKKTLIDVVSVVFNYPSFHDLYKYACYDGLGNLSGHKLREG